MLLGTIGLLCILTVSAQTNDTNATEAPTPVRNRCLTANGVLTKGSRTAICIVIDEMNYTIFYPELDKYSLLEVEKSFDDKLFDNGVLAPTIRVEVGGKSTTALPRKKSNFVVPFYTFIVTLQEGKVSAVTWDDGCWTCGHGSSECLKGEAGDRVCAVDQSTCSSTGKDQVDCDLRLYIGWFGTDKDGNYLTSASKRLSAFRGYSAKDVFDNAAKTAEEAADQF